MTKDYYKILEVERSASQDDIKKSFRKLAKKYHPDVNKGNKKAEEKFKEVTEAHEVLGDADKRKKYDQFGSADFSGFGGGGGTGPGYAHRAYSWNNQQGAQNGADFNIGDIFGDLFGGAGGGFSTGRTSRSRKGTPFSDYMQEAQEDVETSIEIAFEESIKGGTRRLTLQRGGREEKIDVKIPAGIRDGGKIRIPGKGNGGDLYIKVRVAPHQLFTREDDDLFEEVPITFTQAILGDTMKVPTLDGAINLKIPPHTSSGKKFRIPEKGAPHLGQAGRGDLFVIAHVYIPEKLDEEDIEAIRKIHKKIS
ncbi:MAG: DnaJ domain-containing protein [Deltaproteobacteria bacterium]|nr:MAG: DnaJ domain-containing protein [Deltaproteobacteria bacterium]